MENLNSRSVRDRDKRLKKPERWWKDCKRERQRKKCCAELYLSLGPSVEFRTVCSESFLWVMTHHRAGAHRHTHTRTHASMHAVLAERARKQPENTLATRHFAKHSTRTHKHNRTQNSPFVGGGPSCTGTRNGRKVFCQGPLLNSQKGTQTQAREQQPTSTALRHEAICMLRTHGRDTQLQLALSAEGNSRWQHHSSNACANRFALLHNTALIGAASSLNFICKDFFFPHHSFPFFKSPWPCRPFQDTESYITGLLVKWYCRIAVCWLWHSSD